MMCDLLITGTVMRYFAETAKDVAFRSDLVTVSLVSQLVVPAWERASAGWGHIIRGGIPSYGQVRELSQVRT